MRLFNEALDNLVRLETGSTSLSQLVRPYRLGYPPPCHLQLYFWPHLQLTMFVIM